MLWRWHVRRGPASPAPTSASRARVVDPKHEGTGHGLVARLGIDEPEYLSDLAELAAAFGDEAARRRFLGDNARELFQIDA